MMNCYIQHSKKEIIINIKNYAPWLCFKTHFGNSSSNQKGGLRGYHGMKFSKNAECTVCLCVCLM